jgi:hypothetical protein
VEATPPIAKEHAARLPIATLADPLLKHPITVLASIILLNRSNLAILCMDAVDSLCIVLLVSNVLAEATIPHTATAVADEEALVGI